MMKAVVKRLGCNPVFTWNLVVLYAGLIFILSELPKVPRPPGPWYMSFVIHFIEYLGFGLLLLCAMRASKVRRPVMFAVLVGVAYGLSDELHQAFIPGRIASGWDVFFDSLGTIIGVRLADFLGR